MKEDKEGYVSKDKKANRDKGQKVKVLYNMG